MRNQIKMNRLYESLQLKDMGLVLPTKGGTQFQVKIDKGGNNLGEQTILVQHIGPTGFSFCYPNRKPNQDPLRYSFLVTYKFGKLDLDNATASKHWLPPYWVASRIRDVKVDYVFKWVGWNFNYSKRFKSITEKNKLWQKLQKVYLEVNEGKELQDRYRKATRAT
jgi:hypothetical protein